MNIKTTTERNIYITYVNIAYTYIIVNLNKQTLLNRYQNNNYKKKQSTAAFVI